MANNDCNNVTFFFIFSSTKISLKNKLFFSDAFSTFSTQSLDAKRRVNAIASKEEALLPLRTCVKRFQVKKEGRGGGWVWVLECYESKWCRGLWWVGNGHNKIFGINKVCLILLNWT